jgi:hypothetical protein
VKEAKKMHKTALKLEDLSSIKYEFFACTLPDQSRLNTLIVVFEGEYRYGSAGNPDAQFMTAIIKAGLAAWDPPALILDLQQLYYAWGDLMVEVLCSGQDLLLNQPVPTAVVVSDRNVQGLTSLVLDEMLSDPKKWLFTSLESALSSIDAPK